MKIGGSTWYLGAYPYHFSFWDESKALGLVRRVLVSLGMMLNPKPSSELRGIELDVGLVNSTSRSYEDTWRMRLSEAELNGDLKALGLNSHDVGYLARTIETESRWLGITDPDDWRLRTVRYLKRQEHDLLVEEVCAANPGRSVCVDDCGISIG